MKSLKFVKALLLAVVLMLLAPLGCALRTEDGEIGVRSVAVSVEGRPRCAPSRYWDGYRCVRRHYYYRAHYHPYYHYYYYDD